MKKQITAICIIALVALMFASVIQNANAHSGRTDGRGGHTNHSTGEYHYHHGYSAHSHYDMDGDGVVDCPYDFADKTNHSNNSNASIQQAAEKTSSENNTNSNTDFISVVVGIIAFGIYVFLMFVLPSLIKR